MYWRDIVSGGMTYSLAHLDPFSVDLMVAGRNIQLDVTFGHHVFTDEKANGSIFNYNGEQRYFCPVRCRESHQAVDFMQNRVVDAQARAFLNRKRKQQFFVLDLYDYAIFTTIQKPQDTSNVLKCRVVSAYPVDKWGREDLPKTKLREMTYILDMKEQGIIIPVKHR